MSPTICGLRHPITRARCVLAAVDGHEHHEAGDGMRWKARPQNEVVKYDGAGQPVRRAGLPRALRRSR